MFEIYRIFEGRVNYFCFINFAAFSNNSLNIFPMTRY